MALDTVALLRAFERMLLIRRTEEAIVHLREDEQAFGGAYQVYVGQEATGVGACLALREDDYVFTTHRNHGHVMARGGEPEPLIAEILGRRTGYNGGRSGTMHVILPERGIVHTSAMVGGNLPLSAGAAFSAQRGGRGQAVLTFIGDAVFEEGALYESLNMASLWKLPLVVVCENNSIPWDLRRRGQHPSSTHAAADFCEVVRTFSIPAEDVDGTDVEAVRETVGRAVERARRGDGPSFVEARMSRWPGNYMLRPAIVGADTEVSWAWDEAAIPAPLADWSRRYDPILRLARRLGTDGAARQGLLEVERLVRRRVGEARAAAVAAPQPDPATATERVLAGEVL
jgi:TPP-dependent pyruvate/acetoin dehydrogenase alpha subunit